MTDLNYSPGLAAYDHVRFLVENVGERPAGSSKENAALEYIEEQLSRWGYRPARSKVRFAPIPAFAPLWIIASLLLATAGLGLPFPPIFGFLMPVLFILLPFLSRVMVRSRKRSEQAENVFAVSLGNERDPLVMLCAHVDTARVVRVRHAWLRWFNAHSMDVVQRVAYLIAIISLCEMIGLFVPVFLKFISGGAAAISGMLILILDLQRQWGHRNQYSPGAVDNASGVGVVLALAQYFALNPVKRIRLGYLFTAAEETGLHGAESFAEGLSVENKRHLAVINFDMVGAGKDLGIVTRDGTIFSHSTDTRMNQMFRDAFPGAKDLWYTVKSGDYLRFLQHGVPATSLQTCGSREAELSYHTEDDDLSKIEISSLEMTARTTMTVIERFAYTGFFEENAD